jgi:hypothetical protein
MRGVYGKMIAKTIPFTAAVWLSAPLLFCYNFEGGSRL